ncbi:L,D-transpeptidase [Streptomyces graminilatus]|uniref:L,D-transpeptidase n=1 Tax=Streptomyces graminilatus TaxID=1464070 RepID=UPI0006E3A26F|nr:L,D-transpeptidase [Streptomyces graminilatus]
MTRSSAGFVAGLTATALAGVGFLAYQASANAPQRPGAEHVSPSAPVTTAKAPRDTRHPDALPTGSGTGRRVVYSLDDDRVWIVGDNGRALRSFPVAPGTVDPEPGSYQVTSRSNSIMGTDGAPIEHVVRFTGVDGVGIGFSAAVNGSPPPQDPEALTGGIRETRPDGDAMWEFATIGEKVVVIR